ncbi:MAG: indole-3-glycerol phosphate synthase TrpC [Anaerolineae bacterium]|nr:MAG: indole-3-glycerol phosphate synthase TrpC [Anaerolineae bacterium]
MSVSKKARKRGKILDEIMAYEREQLPKRKRAVPLADLRALADFAPEVTGLKAAIGSPGVALIAECKRASPSKGLLVRDYEPVALAQTYVNAGARAISVLTNGRYFQGSLDHLLDVKQALIKKSTSSGSTLRQAEERGIPVLRKDFIFDPYQLFEARAYGADAILLIAAVLEQSQLGRLMSQAADLKMDAMVEVHSIEDLEKALELSPGLIGINNRNLNTFEVDFNNTARLRALIPDGILVVGESGIKGAEDMKTMSRIGVDAVLVGQSLVQSNDIYKSTQALVRAGN